MEPISYQGRGSQFSSLSREMLRDEAARALQSDSFEAKEDVLFATRQRGHDMAPLADEIEALLDSDPEIPNCLILRALANLHHCSDKMLVVFRRELTGTDRCDAHLALQDLAPLTAPLIPLLLERLDEEEGETLPYVIGSLAAMGPLASDAVPCLIELVKDRTGEFRKAWWNFFWEHLHLPSESAAMALGKIGDARAVPVLTEALVRKNRDLRWVSATALGEFGEAATPAVDELVKLAKHREEQAAEVAVTSLRRIGVSTPEVVEGLLHICRHRRRYRFKIRWASLLALGVLGEGQKAVTDLLTAVSESRDHMDALVGSVALRNRSSTLIKKWRLEVERESWGDAALMAAEFVETLGDTAKPVLPEICDLIAENCLWELSDPLDLFNALSAVGPQSPDVQRCLKLAMKSDSFHDRRGAWRALQRISEPQ